jgi:hypothetical protein
MEWLHKYQVCGAAYGAARKLYHLNQRPRIRTRGYNPSCNDYMTRRPLATEQVLTVVVGAALSATLLPVYVGIDLAMFIVRRCRAPSSCALRTTSA